MRKHSRSGVTKVLRQPAAASHSAVDMMLQRLDGLRQRLSEESKDEDELMALSEAIRIVRTYFGK